MAARGSVRVNGEERGTISNSKTAPSQLPFSAVDLHQQHRSTSFLLEDSNWIQKIATGFEIISGVWPLSGLDVGNAAVRHSQQLNVTAAQRRSAARACAGRHRSKN